MDIKTVTVFKRLFLRESTNKKGERCLIGKVVDKTTTPHTDLIVVCNPDTMEQHGIHEVGRWDVEVKPMKSGKGFVVVSADWSFDMVELFVTDFKVELLINGRNEKLKEDDRYIPLFFDCENFYEPKKVAKSIRKKLSYMQIPETVNTEDFIDCFIDQCEIIQKRYKQHINKGVK